MKNICITPSVNATINLDEALDAFRKGATIVMISSNNNKAYIFKDSAHVSGQLYHYGFISFHEGNLNSVSPTPEEVFAKNKSYNYEFFLFDNFREFVEAWLKNNWN